MAAVVIRVQAVVRSDEGEGSFDGVASQVEVAEGVGDLHLCRQSEVGLSSKGFYGVNDIGGEQRVLDGRGRRQLPAYLHQVRIEGVERDQVLVRYAPSDSTAILALQLGAESGDPRVTCGFSLLSVRELGEVNGAEQARPLQLEDLLLVSEALDDVVPEVPVQVDHDVVVDSTM